MSSLVVNTDLSAIGAYNALNSTDQAESRAIQELSTGLSVQTAADGPAAYVTSQALESQANGYGAAISNAQNGVSLVQTASGALNQISSILQTMDQLALSSANGATNDTTSLDANQQEFSALQADINQIAGTTSYGSTNLLDGTFTGQSLQVGAFNLTNQQISLSISAATAGALGVAASGTSGTPGFWTSADPVANDATGGYVQFTLDVDGVDGPFNVTANSTAGDDPSQLLADMQSALSAAGASPYVTASLNASNHIVFTSTATGSSSSVSETTTIQNTVDFGLETGGTSTAGTGSAGVSVATAPSAQAAISAVQGAISTVDNIEAGLGAVQNELQSIAANLTVGQQNLAAANSQLVDVNTAEEMTTFSTDQVLMQTGTAMLAQAQQAPQLVLKLV